ncbi:MAG: type VI secretion system baseplate subunit TssE [Chitinispirillaceae bacterium]|nr:type VI secretion system baseplate subunit TssE [Chitinispirillaceae bacterium]
MNQGLFESLVGRFSDGTPLDAVPSGEQRIMSIKDNLMRIFNTREGVIPHLKNYGLPDISEIYRTMPNGIERLESAIQTTIEQYEPRLRNIRVTRMPQTPGRVLSIEFTLSGEVLGVGRISFQTTFLSSGQSSIGSWKKM